MLDKLTAFADKNDMFTEGLILAAVSGGADSMCLLAVLLELSEKRCFSVAAAHFNHRLRDAESDRDARFVERFCLERNIPVYIGGGDVRLFAQTTGVGIEDAARRMRYDFLHETAKMIGAERIATAHTADDNAETVLLNLARGTGLGGLGGIPPKRDIIIRPMLTVTRAEVLEFLSQRQMTFVEDSTNALDIYARNMVRHRVMPVLRELNPRILEHISVTTSLIREDEKYLNDIAAEFVKTHCVHQRGGSVLDAGELNLLPRSVSSRVIRQIYGNNLSSDHIAAVLALCAGDSASGETGLPGGIAFREYDKIILTCEAEPACFQPVEIAPGEKVALNELGLSATCRKISSPQYAGNEKINKSFTTFLFKSDNICGKIVIRPRETGDKIDLFGRNGTKTLKKLFIEQRIPRRLRSLIPVITDEKGVLAVYGIGMDERAAICAGEEALEIIFEETAYEK